MINVRTYMQKKAERKAGEAQSRDFGALIQKHRLAVFGRTLFVIFVFALLGTLVYVQLKNQVYTSYVILSSIALYFGQGNGMQAIRRWKQKRIEKKVYSK